MPTSSSKLSRLGGGTLFDAIRLAADRGRLALVLCFRDADQPEVWLLNDYAALLAGYTQAEVTELGPWALTEPEEIPRLRRILSSIGTADPLRSFETTLITKHKKRVPVEVTLSDVVVEERSAVFAFVSDVSERWRAIAALQESEERFRLVVEGAPDGVVILEGPRIRFLNPRAARMLGLPNSEAGHGQPIMNFLHLDDAPLAAERIKTLLQTGKVHREPAEYRSRSIEGNELVVEISSIPIEIGGERTVLAFARDVTERKAIQKKLAEAERLTALGVLSAGVAHEINNPLAYVLLNLEYLRRELPKCAMVDAERIEELMLRVRDACHGADRVATIVRDLRTFARGETSVLGPVDLRDAIEAAVDIAESTLNQKVTLVKEYADAPLVEGNQNRLEQVFLNLLLNAAQAMPNGDPERDCIRVKLRAEPGFAIVEVSDTGEGIEPAVLSRIFDPFFTTKPVGVGTGLGLPICRSIVATHNGTIEVRSRRGEGTTFRVSLPASSATRVEPGPVSSQPPPGVAPRGRVLVVDDEIAVGNTLKLVLQGEHDVKLATSAYEALELLSEGRFDAVVCDLMMPGMTGFDLREAVRKTHPWVEERMIFMTGGAPLAQSEAFLDSLKNPLLEKPFDIPLIRRILRRLVARSHSAR